MNVIITEENAGERLDTVLGASFDTSRTDIQNRVKSGHVRSIKNCQTEYKVKTDDLISFERENVSGYCS